ncbi:hypothetical protein ACIBUY_13535 [Streptomyces sp. NPDC050085]|uniref:hypothetical protein n=1 Tax=Streptomyces sp. NPDC050085 TaxID=3365600 RepID=UPI0037B3A25D
MRRITLFVALVLAVAGALPAAAAPAAPPPPTSAAPVLTDAPAPGTPEDKHLGTWLELVEKDPNRYVQELEESCIQTGSKACRMTAADIARIPGDLKKASEEFQAELASDPELAAEVKQEAADARRAALRHGPHAQNRSALPNLGRVVRTLAAHSKNAAVRSMGKLNADKIGDFADNVSRAVYAHNGVKESTAASIAKIAIYSTPVIGDVFSLGEVIFSKDMPIGERIEGGVVAAVSLAGAAAAVAFPPLGAAIGVGVATYYVGKAIWGWLCGGAKEEEWVIDPPLTPQDLYDRGADIRWETHPVAGRQVAVEVWDAPPRSAPDWANLSWDPIPPGQAHPPVPSFVRPVNGWLPHPDDMTGHTVTQKLLLDSKWSSDKRHQDGLLPYELEQLDVSGGLVREYAVHLGNTWGAQSAEFAVWQDGKKYEGRCSVQKYHHPVGQPQAVEVYCGLAPSHTMHTVPRVVVSENHPAVVEIATTYDLSQVEPQYRCTPAPACIPAGAQKTPPQGSLRLVANSGTRHQTVTLDMDYSYAIVSPPATASAQPGCSGDQVARAEALAARESAATGSRLTGVCLNDGIYVGFEVMGVDGAADPGWSTCTDPSAGIAAMDQAAAMGITAPVSAACVEGHAYGLYDPVALPQGGNVPQSGLGVTTRAGRDS